MKILLPTAKEMATPETTARMSTLSQPSQAVLTALSQLDRSGLAQLYKLTPDKTEFEVERLNLLVSAQAPTYPAWQLFDGLMYRQMIRQGLTGEQETYVRQHLYITSAFYGVINAMDLISPHRLDFQMGLKVGGQSLKQYWRPVFEEAVANDDVLISLLSSEFETVFSKTTQDRMIKLTFMEEVKGQLRVHSTISKKARGQFVNALIAQQVTELTELKKLQVAGFVYRENLSEARQLVFVKEV